MEEAPPAGDVHLQGPQQQIVKVQGPQLLQPLAVGLKEGLVHPGLPRRHAVFHPGDALEQSTGTGPAALGGQELRRQRQGLPLVQQPHVPQKLQAEGVEGADVEPGGGPLAPQPGLQAGAQLPGGLIGEGDGGDLPGQHPLLPDEPGHPVRQGFGLARPRPGGDGHHRLRGRDRRLLLRVPLRRSGGLPFFGGGGAEEPLFRAPFDGGLGLEQGDLAAQPSDLPRGEQGDDPVLPVKPGPPLHLTGPQAADPLGHAGPGSPLDIGGRGLPEDVELRPQPGEHVLVQRQRPLGGGGRAGGGGDDLRQGGQALKGLGPLGPEARRAVRQGLHPVLHADGQLFAAHGAPAVPLLGLGGGEAHAAAPVAVQVVLALLREELNRAQKPRPGADGPDQTRVGQGGVQEVRFPAQLGGGVGVGVGDQGEPVQAGEPPVHGRV